MLYFISSGNLYNIKKINRLLSLGGASAGVDKFRKITSSDEDL
jgi:hypothetical protein